MTIIKEPATPPPTIGKMGPYTVFVTPSSDPSSMSVSESPKKYTWALDDYYESNGVKPSNRHHIKNDLLPKAISKWSCKWNSLIDDERTMPRKHAFHRTPYEPRQQAHY
ncbi:hypothetical protein Ccrd_025303 [Cynara cardunculus var. scolymus]|uniref:Uncharacterized protein n=1 Tax=Cynara cardunculus var. scolymus TaxID=59895 RepID=A0A103XB34_CYNCS|nr:hypothetical protein Ccrd_025303 [Cynara cardunculus var. scolymus]